MDKRCEGCICETEVENLQNMQIMRNAYLAMKKKRMAMEAKEKAVQKPDQPAKSQISSVEH